MEEQRVMVVPRTKTEIKDNIYILELPFNPVLSRTINKKVSILNDDSEYFVENITWDDFDGSVMYMRVRKL